MKPKDIYAIEVARLSKLSQFERYLAWTYGDQHSPLFDAPSVSRQITEDCPLCVCDMQHAGMVGFKLDNPLYLEMARDLELPFEPEFMNIKHLKRFAYWQRRCDKEIAGRLPPNDGNKEPRLFT